MSSIISRLARLRGENIGSWKPARSVVSCSLHYEIKNSDVGRFVLRGRIRHGWRMQNRFARRDRFDSGRGSRIRQSRSRAGRRGSSGARLRGPRGRGSSGGGKLAGGRAGQNSRRPGCLVAATELADKARSRAAFFAWVVRLSGWRRAPSGDPGPARCGGARRDCVGSLGEVAGQGFLRGDDVQGIRWGQANLRRNGNAWGRAKRGVRATDFRWRLDLGRNQGAHAFHFRFRRSPAFRRRAG